MNSMSMFCVLICPFDTSLSMVSHTCLSNSVVMFLMCFLLFSSSIHAAAVDFLLISLMSGSFDNEAWYAECSFHVIHLRFDGELLNLSKSAWCITLAFMLPLCMHLPTSLCVNSYFPVCGLYTVSYSETHPFAIGAFFL